MTPHGPPQKVVGLWLAHHGVSQTYARSLGCLSKGGAWLGLGATEREGWGWTLPTNNGSY